MEFHPNRPKGCPPDDAPPVDIVVYRAVADPPIAAKHFLSHAENGTNCDLADCKSWGLSVWVSRAHAEHAQRIMRSLIGSAYIVAGRPKPTEGVLKHTPSKRQPQHHTLWKVDGLDISQRFSIVLQPLPRK